MSKATTDSQKPVVAVLVDAYAAAANFVPSFQRKGLQCVHVQTSPTVLPVYAKSFLPSAFLQCFTYTGDLEALIHALSAFDVRCVLAGLDPGVELADTLGSKLGLVRNDLQLSRARRDKFLMARALSEAGLPTPKFAEVSTLKELLGWMEASSTQYPVVLKPLDSGGSDGVHICENERALTTAFSELIGKRNVLGSLNSRILAQSFLNGDEYIVNSVSRDGQVAVVAILQSRKHRVDGYGFIYDREVMLPSTGEVSDSLVSMHVRVLGALGIANGAAHGEYMLTSDGPVLIEVGARISGGVHPTANQASVSVEQIDLTVDAYVDYASFQRRTVQPYVLSRQFYQVLLSTACGGIVGDVGAFLQELSKLPSFHDARLKVHTNQEVTRTVDLVTSLGSVFLVHECATTIEQDYQTILELAGALVSRHRD